MLFVWGENLLMLLAMILIQHCLLQCGGQHSVPEGQSLLANCGANASGQYVFLTIPGPSKVLTLCEVAVYGVTQTSAKPHSCKGRSAGLHFIRPLGETSDIAVFCDGNGWTRVGHWSQGQAPASYTLTPVENADPMVTGFSAAYSKVKGTQVRIGSKVGDLGDNGIPASLKEALTADDATYSCAISGNLQINGEACGTGDFCKLGYSSNVLGGYSTATCYGRCASGKPELCRAPAEVTSSLSPLLSDGIWVRDTTGAVPWAPLFPGYIQLIQDASNTEKTCTGETVSIDIGYTATDMGPDIQTCADRCSDSIACNAFAYSYASGNIGGCITYTSCHTTAIDTNHGFNPTLVFKKVKYSPHPYAALCDHSIAPQSIAVYQCFLIAVVLQRPRWFFRTYHEPNYQVVLGAAPTTLSQTAVFSSLSALDSETKDVIEKGYGRALDIYSTIAGRYREGCSVNAIIASRRSLSVTFEAVVSANYLSEATSASQSMTGSLLDTNIAYIASAAGLTNASALNVTTVSPSISFTSGERLIESGTCEYHGCMPIASQSECDRMAGIMQGLSGTMRTVDTTASRIRYGSLYPVGCSVTPSNGLAFNPPPKPGITCSANMPCLCRCGAVFNNTPFASPPHTLRSNLNGANSFPVDGVCQICTFELLQMFTTGTAAMSQWWCWPDGRVRWRAVYRQD